MNVIAGGHPVVPHPVGGGQLWCFLTTDYQHEDHVGVFIPRGTTEAGRTGQPSGQHIRSLSSPIEVLRIGH